MQTRPTQGRYLAFLEASSSQRRAAEKRLAKAYRLAKLPQPTDSRAIALAVALSEVSDSLFLSQMIEAESKGWQELPPPPFVRLRLVWDMTMDGDYGHRDVRGWTGEHVEVARAAVAERSKRPLNEVISTLWVVDRRVAVRSSAISSSCFDAPMLHFGVAPEDRLSPIRDGEPYFFVNGDDDETGSVVGAYHAWYAVKKGLLAQYQRDLHFWISHEWPEALDVFADEEPLDGFSFGSWATRRTAEAFVRRLTFEEATYMIMEDQRMEDSSWL